MDVTNPTPEDLDEARDLPRAILVRFLERWRRMVAESARSFELAATDPSLERWASLERWHLVDAETALVRAILTTSGDRAVDMSFWPERRRWPNRGVVVDGRLYAAVADPSREGEEGDDQYALMRLVVIDMAKVVNFGRSSADA